MLQTYDQNSNPLSSHLRAHTAHDHRRAEHTLPLFNENFSRENYRSLLEKLFIFFEHYKEALLPWKGLDVPHFEHRLQRSEWIKSDLLFLGTSPQPSKIPNEIELNTKSEVLGAMYVIEGSSLGGQIITRHLKSSLNLPDQAMNFYRSYGEDTRMLWFEFKDYLDRQHVSADALIKARQIFSHFEKYLI